MSLEVQAAPHPRSSTSNRRAASWPCPALSACILLPPLLSCPAPTQHTCLSPACLHPPAYLSPHSTCCSPADILKFYGCELGAQTNFDKNTGTSIVNGAHDTKKLCELLEQFIKK